MAINVYSSVVGVGINEIDNSIVSTFNSSSFAFFSGFFERGSCNSLIRVNSQKELLDTFDYSKSTNINDWSQANNYLQYAGNLIISRSVGNKSLNSVAEFPNNQNAKPELIYNLNDFENKVDKFKLKLGNQLKFFSKDPGTWGNDISLMMINKSDFDLNITIFNNIKAQSIFREIEDGESGLLVFFKGIPVEIYVISFNSASSSFIEKINYTSKYIFIKYVESLGTIDGYYRFFDGEEAVTSLLGLIKIKFNFESDTDFNLNDINVIGGEFSNLEKKSDSEYIADFNPSEKFIKDIVINLTPSLPNCEITSDVYFDGNLDLRDHPSFSDLTKDVVFSFYGVNQIYLKGGELFEPSLNDLEYSFDVARNKEVEIDYIIANEKLPLYAKQIADERKDCITFIGMPRFFGTTAEKIQQTFDFKTQMGNSDFCFLIMNSKKIYDNVTKKYFYSNLAADACGLRVKTDTNLNRWSASAGESRGTLIGGELDFYPNRNEIDDFYIKGINSFIKNSNGSIKLFGNRIMTTKASSLDRLSTRVTINYIIRELEKLARYSIFELLDRHTENVIEQKFKKLLNKIKLERGIKDYYFQIKTDKVAQQLNISVFYQPNYVADFIQINFINTGTSALTTVK